ncbi:unnamed protein product [Triticum turgidum subsp. durum]|uniref:Fatty acyl-CoA reductase n=1 Tax=Triticum turgidum subsp. durum TaxID=4567 RepID=A0A9R1AMC5_TRITD|nr:unnamed protein product [Triticum turgidum subsp. durum]
MVSTLNEQKITEYFKNKSILVTGSTGFLGKILVEKILRVQPDVKKIYLPVRAVDAAAAKHRVENEVVGKELFGLLREKHGDGFKSFIQEKIVPLAGDVMGEDFGIDPETLKELRLTEELEVIVNGAATTNFYERTIDTIVIGYAKQNLTYFLADLDLTMDVIPGDMVVNAIIAAIVMHASSSFEKIMAHPKPRPPAVYHVTSSLRHPVSYNVLHEAGFRYFTENPRMGPDGRPVHTHKMSFLRSIASFQLFMVLRYRLFLELLHLLSIICCGLFGLGTLYHDHACKYRFVMQLVDLYGPFALFKGCFDDVNLHKLRLTMADDHASLFNFDPKTIDWDDYFYRVHIPGVIKYLVK